MFEHRIWTLKFICCSYSQNDSKEYTAIGTAVHVFGVWVCVRGKNPVCVFQFDWTEWKSIDCVATRIHIHRTLCEEKRTTNIATTPPPPPRRWHNNILLNIHKRRPPFSANLFSVYFNGYSVAIKMVEKECIFNEVIMNAHIYWPSQNDSQCYAIFTTDRSFKIRKSAKQHLLCIPLTRLRPIRFSNAKDSFPFSCWCILEKRKQHTLE